MRVIFSDEGILKRRDLNEKRYKPSKRNWLDYPSLSKHLKNGRGRGDGKPGKTGRVLIEDMKKEHVRVIKIQAFFYEFPIFS